MADDVNGGVEESNGSCSNGNAGAEPSAVNKPNADRDAEDEEAFCGDGDPDGQVVAEDPS